MSIKNLSNDEVILINYKLIKHDTADISIDSNFYYNNNIEIPEYYPYQVLIIQKL